MDKNDQDNFIILLSQISARLTKRVEGQLNMHGISFTEFLILQYLNKANKKVLRRIKLADLVGISASGITRLIAPMEKLKLVEKEINPRDARVSLVKLSKSGERVYQEALVSFEESSNAILKQISRNQLNTLMDLTAKLL